MAKIPRSRRARVTAGGVEDSAEVWVRQETSLARVIANRLNSGNEWPA